MPIRRRPSSRASRGRSAGARPSRPPRRKAALDELSTQLLPSGWTAAGREGDEWHELAFTRPSLRPVVDDLPSRDEEHDDPDDLGSELLEQLRDEVREARAEAARERRGRLAAEAEATRQAPKLTAVPALAEAGPPRSPRRLAPLLALYATAVVAAAAGMYLGFHSVYATVVAALTVAAVALGVDSWRVARSVSR